MKKEILGLAIPATVEQTLHALVSFVDTFLIAKLGLVAVAAVSLANSVLTVYLAVYLALGVGATALVSRSLGARKKERARKETRQIVVLSLFIGLGLSLLSLIGGRLVFTLMGAGEETLAAAQLFFYWVGGWTFLQALMTSLGAVLRATGDTLRPMKISFWVNLINLALDYVLVFGLGSWSGLGLLGTAIGTVVARLVGVGLLYHQVQRTDLAIQRGEALDWQGISSLWKVTAPAILERLVMRMGQVVYFSLILELGTKVYAAHMIAGTIESMTYLPASGLATAASIGIGHAVGERNSKRVITTRENGWLVHRL